MSESFESEVENANHEPELKSEELKLRISFFKYNLTKCPLCFTYIGNEELCFEHFLNHFDNSQNFLFQRLNLLYWLSNYFTKPKSIPEEVMPLSVTDVNMNYSSIEKGLDSEEIKPREFSCVVCGRLFLTEHSLHMHMIVHAKIRIPAVSLQLKCPLCEKYFCTEESCLVHLFTHFHIADVEKKRLSIMNWLKIFFLSPSSKKIVAKYDQYATELNSPLLSRIRVAEVTSVTVCKICKQSVSSVFDLLDNHKSCNIEAPPAQLFFYCVLCNFKASSEVSLAKHFFVSHIVCYCGNHEKDFTSLKRHIVRCSVHKNGILCPICRSKNFMTKEAFEEHITLGSRRSCGADLKRNKWNCLLCGMQASQKAIFHHLLSKHVSCCCGYKNANFECFGAHTDKCSKNNLSLVCPVCDRSKCSSPNSFEKHIVSCMPWKEVNEGNKVLRIHEVNGVQKIILRHETEELVESPKRQKIMINTILRFDY